MHRSETDSLQVCSDCGRETASVSERAFAPSGETVLCYECCVSRGGAWDEAQSRWRVEPDMSGLSIDDTSR